SRCCDPMPGWRRQPRATALTPAPGGMPNSPRWSRVGPPGRRGCPARRTRRQPVRPVSAALNRARPSDVRGTLHVPDLAIVRPIISRSGTISAPRRPLAPPNGAGCSLYCAEKTATSQRLPLPPRPAACTVRTREEGDVVTLGVLKETKPAERRVTLVPDDVRRLRDTGATIVVQRTAGDESGFADEQFAAAGARF